MPSDDFGWRYGDLRQSWRYILRAILGILFIWAALAKIGDLAGFASQVHNFRLMPRQIENLFAMTLPWVELLAGVALVLNQVPRAANLVLGSLLVVFLVAIVSALLRKLDIECGCFGTHDAGSTGWKTLARDLAFLALAWFGHPRLRTSKQDASRSMEAA
jgi:uncharacterized membrane protein YphA (DoxX/SURF4 family)